MNAFLKSRVLLALMLALAWAGCDTTREVVRPSEAPVRVSGVYHGSGVVKTIDAQRVVVALDERPTRGAPDGEVDHVFTFQLDEPLATPLDWSARALTVYHVKGNLYVRSSTDALHLRTSGFDLVRAQQERTLLADEAIVASRASDLAWSSPVEGVGLAHQLVPEGTSFTLAEAARRDAYVPVAEGACAPSLSFRAGLASAAKTADEACGPGHICLSGGEGSTSCSHGGCSVSCASTYFACCSGVAGCKCCKGGGATDPEVGN